LFSTSSEVEKIDAKFTSDSLKSHIDEELYPSGSLESLGHVEGMTYSGPLKTIANGRRTHEGFSVYGRYGER
jgi:hypothetical protein